MKNLIVIILVLGIGNVYSQGFQFAGFESTIFPTSISKTANVPANISFQEYGVFFKAPYRLKNEKTVIINQLNYDLLQATISDSPAFSLNRIEKRLHKIAYTFMLVHQLNEKWSFITRLKPTIVSDFERKLSNNDFIFQGIALASREINIHTKLGAGLVYTTQTGEPLLLPAILFNYHKGIHSLNVLLPSQIKYLVALTENGRLKIGAKAKLNGGNYAARLDNFDTPGLDAINNIVYSRFNTGLLLNVQLSQMMMLELSGGMSLRRIFNFIDTDEVKLQYDSENGVFFSANLYFMQSSN